MLTEPKIPLASRLPLAYEKDYLGKAVSGLPDPSLRGIIRLTCHAPNVEVTPEMIEAGLEFLYGEEPYCSRPASKEEIIRTLKLLYPAMHAARLQRQDT